MAGRAKLPLSRRGVVYAGDAAYGQRGEMRSIYDSLNLPDPDYIEPKIRDYVQSIDGYSKNSFPELPDDVRERLTNEWSRCFNEWQYAE